MAQSLKSMSFYSVSMSTRLKYVVVRQIFLMVGQGCWIRSVHVLTRRRCDGGRRGCGVYGSGMGRLLAQAKGPFVTLEQNGLLLSL